MEQKTVKISFENYRWLARLAAEIQKEKEKPISLDEALTKVKEGKMSKKRITNFAGTWKMSDEETEKLKRDIKGGWNSWTIKSV